MRRAIVVLAVLGAVGCGGPEESIEPPDAIVEGCLSAGAESTALETDRRVVCTWPCDGGQRRQEVYLGAPAAGWHFDETRYVECASSAP